MRWFTRVGGGYLPCQDLSGWQQAIPALWIFYVVGLIASIFISDENWLYPRYGIDGSFVADTVMAVAYIMMGVKLWSVTKEVVVLAYDRPSSARRSSPMKPVNSAEKR